VRSFWLLRCPQGIFPDVLVQITCFHLLNYFYLFLALCSFLSFFFSVLGIRLSVVWIHHTTNIFAFLICFPDRFSFWPCMVWPSSQTLSPELMGLQAFLFCYKIVGSLWHLNISTQTLCSSWIPSWHLFPIALWSSFSKSFVSFCFFLFKFRFYIWEKHGKTCLCQSGLSCLCFY
jgi:hypothetical protein